MASEFPDMSCGAFELVTDSSSTSRTLLQDRSTGMTDRQLFLTRTSPGENEFSLSSLVEKNNNFPGSFPYSENLSTTGNSFKVIQYKSRTTDTEKDAKQSTNILKIWLQQHNRNPYPSKKEKTLLAIKTNLTVTQISTWFANARRRLKKENKLTWNPRHRSNHLDASKLCQLNIEEQNQSHFVTKVDVFDTPDEPCELMPSWIPQLPHTPTSMDHHKQSIPSQSQVPRKHSLQQGYGVYCSKPEVENKQVIADEPSSFYFQSRYSTMPHEKLHAPIPIGADIAQASDIENRLRFHPSNYAANDQELCETFLSSPQRVESVLYSQTSNDEITNYPIQSTNFEHSVDIYQGDAQRRSSSASQYHSDSSYTNPHLLNRFLSDGHEPYGDSEVYSYQHSTPNNQQNQYYIQPHSCAIGYVESPCIASHMPVHTYI